jgi:small acid-soluble spore protein (thioredoxin-like protein)
MAKPDDRSDNVEKLQEMIQNTMENLRESEDFLAAHAGDTASEDVAVLEEKNRRREQSIEGFRNEIKDEEEDAQS